MKIALVVHDYHRAGGHSRYVAELAERFAAKHEVHIFANRVEGPKYPGIDFHHVPAWRLRSLTTILTFLLPATRRLRSSFDIVHTQGLCAFRQDVITAHICSAAWFKAQSAHQGRLTFAQHISRALITPLERHAFQNRQSQRVIAISHRVRDDIGEYYGRAQHVDVVYHGVDLERFNPIQRLRYRSDFRRAVGVGDKEFLALYVGDLQKGGAVAIDAIAQAPEAHLAVVSRSPYEPYAAQARRLGISARIHFVAPSSTIERAYAGADALLFPTFYDAFGMVITEAMASGLPVITSTAAGASELIERGHDGILVDSSSDPTPFAEALRRLIVHPALRHEIGARARETSERLCWDTVARETLRIYERTIGERVRRSAAPHPIVAFLVNGSASSAAGTRARAFAQRLSGDFDIRLLFRSSRKVLSALWFLGSLVRMRPRVVYVVDTAFTGVLAAAAYKLVASVPVVLDTGDLIHELATSLGTRGRLSLWLTKRLELFAAKIADHLVVRGTRHREFVSIEKVKRTVVVQDGVDLERFQVVDSADLRRRYALDGVFTIGLVGTVIWSDRLNMGYGWELVETLALLKDLRLKGVLIGGGPGIERLRSRCRELGVEDRMLFVGEVPYTSLPVYLGLIDVCLSTQTNDRVGQARTTGKLPLYAATGRYILASNVGEASLVLPVEMLLPYDGIRDTEYPRRLAARIRVLARDTTFRERGLQNREIAKAFFDYDALAPRVGKIIFDALAAVPR